MGSMGNRSLLLLATILRTTSRFLSRVALKVSTSPLTEHSSNDETYGFSGWGMMTSHANPWATGKDSLPESTGADFATADRNLRKLIHNDLFHLSQFSFTGKSSHAQVRKILDYLRWRHYVVFLSARLARQLVEACSSDVCEDDLYYVELGVCDGLTAYFALQATADFQPRRPLPKFVLIDSWGPMREVDFGKGDLQQVGAYSYLQKRRTEKNLAPWMSRCSLIEGYIPEALKHPNLPKRITWMHIDLNSSLPTIAALNVLVSRVARGGVILFDDYGSRDFFETKHAVDGFFRTLDSGMFISLPTGQGIWINSGWPNE